MDTKEFRAPEKSAPQINVWVVVFFFFILDQKIITVYYGACNICKMYVNNSKKVGRRETEEISLLVSHTSLK